MGWRGVYDVCVCVRASMCVCVGTENIKYSFLLHSE